MDGLLWSAIWPCINAWGLTASMRRTSCTSRWDGSDALQGMAAAPSWPSIHLAGAAPANGRGAGIARRMMPSPPRSLTPSLSSMPIRTSRWASRPGHLPGPLPKPPLHSLLEPAISSSRTTMERSLWPRQNLALLHASTMSPSVPTWRYWYRWRCQPHCVNVVRPYLPHSAPRSGPDTPPRSSPTPLSRASAVPSLSVCNGWVRGLMIGSAKLASRPPTAMRPQRYPATIPNAGISKSSSTPIKREAGSAPERQTCLGVPVIGPWR